MPKGSDDKSSGKVEASAERPRVVVPTVRTSAERVAGPITGVMLGHAIAKGKSGFPGDPLPGGEIGSAANVAFWSSMFDDDEEDD